MQETPSAPSPEHHNQHMQTEHIAPPAPATHHHTAEQQAAITADYPSDAIQTTKIAFNTFWQNGKKAVGGIIAIQALMIIVTAILALVAISAAVVGTIGVMANVNGGSINELFSGSLATQLPPQSAQALESFLTQSAANSGTVGLIGLIAFVLAIGLGTYTQAVVMSLVGSTVTENQKAHFGQVMSRAFKRTGPLFVQGILIILAVIVAVLIPTVLLASGPAAAILAMLLYIAFAVVFVYFAVRLALAPLIVVALGMGPVQSLKYSWAQTKHRFWEILGAVSVVAVFTTIIDIVFLYIHSSLKAAGGVDIVISLIEVAIVLFTNFITFAVLAERLNQFRHTDPSHQSTHKINYLTNIGAFALAIFISIIASSIDQSLNPRTNLLNNSDLSPNSSQSTDSDPDVNTDELQKELEKYYQEGKDLNNSQLNDQYYGPETPTDDSYRVN